MFHLLSCHGGPLATRPGRARLGVSERVHGIARGCRGTLISLSRLWQAEQVGMPISRRLLAHLRREESFLVGQVRSALVEPLLIVDRSDLRQARRQRRPETRLPLGGRSVVEQSSV